MKKLDNSGDQARAVPHRARPRAPSCKKDRSLPAKHGPCPTRHTPVVNLELYQCTFSPRPSVTRGRAPPSTPPCPVPVQYIRNRKQNGYAVIPARGRASLGTGRASMLRQYK
ncbi:hypothetical protein L1987_24523 [Smallanthus sonchifolius]|uniref:Uncharacterized protein n=1 Tax=Smallanthus sonchifolius TaxID=185202 RepID=A0ACB9IJZ3_9ASTR|nr:hypothetical protein L1987_24523 [Smallanthus sonchifolius]